MFTLEYWRQRQRGPRAPEIRKFSLLLREETVRKKHFLHNPEVFLTVVSPKTGVVRIGRSFDFPPVEERRGTV